MVTQLKHIDIPFYFMKGGLCIEENTLAIHENPSTFLFFSTSYFVDCFLWHYWGF